MAYDPDSLGEATDQIAQAGLVRFEVHLAGNKPDDVAMIDQIYNDINIPNPPRRALLGW